MIRYVCRTLVAFLLTFGLSVTTWGLTIESDDFVAEVERLRDLTFDKNTNLYVEPTPAERNDFSTLASTLWAGDIAQADLLAGALSYEIVEFTNTITGDVYHGLRELLVNGDQTLGWGSYFVNLAFNADNLVEVPHPRFDTNSWNVGAKVFQQAEARGFMMAGAHRNANGPDTADVAHLTASIFQEAHEAWNGLNGEIVAWQLHGFAISNHPTFPAGTDVVLSNGDGGVSPEVIALDALFDSTLDSSNDPFLSHAYNTLAINDPLNVLVNGGVAGTTFSGLGATTNEQGIYSRGIGGTFVHIELEQSIRFDSDNRDTAAGLISDAMLSVPEPSTIVLFSIALLGTIVIIYRRKKQQWV